MKLEIIEIILNKKPEKDFNQPSSYLLINS